jgi:TolA-binding protein
MIVRERESLITRIRQIRRAAPARGTPAPSPAVDPRRNQAADPRQEVVDPQQDEIRALDARLTHLEQLLQGLQDSVHRESERQSRRIAELEEQIKPAVLGKALSKDARERGL